MSIGATAPARAALLCIVVGAGLAAGGCGAPRLARAPTPATDLGGHWVLDPAVSDDAAAAIAAVIPARAPPAARPQSPDPSAGGSGGDTAGRNRRSGGRGSGAGSNSTANTQGAAPAPLSRRGVGELLRAFAQPAARLDIESEPGRIAIAAGGRERRFEPGAEAPVAVTDRFGSRTVSAGWRNAEFLVVSVDHQRLEVVEHYHAGGGDTLESQVQVSASGLKKLTVHTVYRRATAAEIAAPASDGPPAPGPH